MRIGIFGVNTLYGGVVEPMTPTGAKMPDQLAGCLGVVTSAEISGHKAVVHAGGTHIATPRVDPLINAKVVHRRSVDSLGDRFLTKVFGSGAGGRVEKYLVAKLGAGVKTDLHKLNDHRFNCLLACILNDGNKASLTAIIHRLAAGQLVDVSEIVCGASLHDGRTAKDFVFSGKIRAKAPPLKRLNLVRTSAPLPPVSAQPLHLQFEAVQQGMETFFRHYSYPGVTQQRLVLDNTPAGVLRLGLVTPDGLMECFRTARPLLHPRLKRYLKGFLAHKKLHGSSAEKALYAVMTPDQLLDRLVGLNNKRWAVFLPESDFFVDTRGSRYSSQLPAPGQENAAFLAEHLSWDEVFISSLISVSAKTPFLSRGARNTVGDAEKKDGRYVADDGHAPMGVYTGSVGPYLCRTGMMDHRFMVVTPRHTADRGYGLNHPFAPPRGLEDIAAVLFGADHLPTIDEARADRTGRFIKVVERDEYLDIQIYKERLRLVIEPFLRDAADRAAKEGKRAYVRVDGLGLGLWALQGTGQFGAEAPMPISHIQAKLMLEVYREVLAADPALSAKISTVDFRWIAGLSPTDDDITSLGEIGITRLIASRSNPADPLPPGLGNELLVAQWSWNGNSMTGNEWWNGCGSFSSSDSNAAQFSLVGFTHNGIINPLLAGPWRREM